MSAFSCVMLPCMVTDITMGQYPIQEVLQKCEMVHTFRS